MTLGFEIPGCNAGLLVGGFLPTNPFEQYAKRQNGKKIIPQFLG